MLGRALRGRRDQAIIATKFGGMTLDDSGKIVGGPNGHPDYIRKSLEGSLRRLDTDYIDLYYQHRVDPNVPLEETFGVLGQLVSEGHTELRPELAVALLFRASAMQESRLGYCLSRPPPDQALLVARVASAG